MSYKGYKLIMVQELSKVNQSWTVVKLVKNKQKNPHKFYSDILQWGEEDVVLELGLIPNTQKKKKKKKKKKKEVGI